jgi:hypothetical protein
MEGILTMTSDDRCMLEVAARSGSLSMTAVERLMLQARRERAEAIGQLLRQGATKFLAAAQGLAKFVRRIVRGFLHWSVT